MNGGYFMNIGYVRVSTIDQNEARQVRALDSFNIDKIFIEKASGKDTNRKILNEMISFVRDGDVVIVESYSRIARNTSDLLNVIDSLSKKGVHFRSIKENINTSTPQGKLMLTMFGALYQFERECLLERQREGIAIAKEQKKYKGKPKMVIDEQAFKRECMKWRDGKQTATATMNNLGLKSNTFYRRVKEYNI